MDCHPSPTIGLSLFPLMNRHGPAPGPTAGCAYIAVGMQRALDWAIGFRGRATNAAPQLWFLMPPEVSNSFMMPPRSQWDCCKTVWGALHRTRPSAAPTPADEQPRNHSS